MKVPGLDAVLDDVKDMQTDLNTRLDRIADLLVELLEVQRGQADAAKALHTALHGINPDKETT